VVGQTRIESGTILSKSSGERITLAGAVTFPGLTAKPSSVGPVLTLRGLGSNIAISIGPNFIRPSGGTAVGGSKRFRASRSSRRSCASLTKSGRLIFSARAVLAAANSVLFK